MKIFKLNLTKKIFSVLIVINIISNIGLVSAQATGGLKIMGQGILDNADPSALSIDTNNRKLYFPDGTTGALNWSTAGKILINGVINTDNTSALQVKSESDDNIASFYNDTNSLTIKNNGQIVSIVPLGTKPFNIISTTLNNNLNAELLDGFISSAFALSNQSVKYTINGSGLTIPTIIGQSGKILTNNGTALSWGAFSVSEADTLATVTARGGITTTPLTLGQLTITDGYNIILGTSGGTKIGTTTNQKLAFFGATPIVQPTNTVALDTALANLGLRASGNPFVSTNFKIGTAGAGTDYTLTFDGETTDGVLTWLEDEDQFKFTDRIQTDGGILGKITTVTDTYNILASDETIVGNKATNFTITLPTAVTGQIFTVKNIGLGNLAVVANDSDVINLDSLVVSIPQWGTKTFRSIAANKWLMY
jgi:hypothetical protein